MNVFYARELDGYPVGRRRIWLLLMAVLASLIASYESQISPVLPLLLKGLDMKLTTYGLIAAASVIAGGVAAYFGGRLADQRGRVVLLVPTLILTGLADLAMMLVHSQLDLLIVRCVLSLFEGAAITTTAGLVRDFSPRVGRATAFGFWTWGPVGANFLAAAIAGWTLPIFGTWQSQFAIMGGIALALSVLIAFNIADLTPTLRARIIDTEQEGTRAEAEAAAPVEIGKVRQLLSHPHIWAHVLGITSWLVLYETLVIYGPTMIVQSFHVSPARAATVMALFWVLNLATLLVIGWISDRLGLRKPISLVGTILATATMAYLIRRIGNTDSTAEIAVIGSVLGIFLGMAYVPWMAIFSENLEDIRASLQATGWGIWGLAVRLMILVLLLMAPVVVALTAGWTIWLIVATVFEALYIPAIFAFRGPWLRARSQVASTPSLS
jgi:MFS family permease